MVKKAKKKPAPIIIVCSQDVFEQINDAFERRIEALRDEDEKARAHTVKLGYDDDALKASARVFALTEILEAIDMGDIMLADPDCGIEHRTPEEHARIEQEARTKKARKRAVKKTSALKR